MPFRHPNCSLLELPSSKRKSFLTLADTEKHFKSARAFNPDTFCLPDSKSQSSVVPSIKTNPSIPRHPLQPNEKCLCKYLGNKL